MIFLNYNLLQIINKLFIKIISKIEKKTIIEYKLYSIFLIIFFILYIYFLN